MTTPAFPNLTFEDPTALVSEPGTNRLYVCGRQGTIWFFQNDPNTTSKTVFLSLTNQNQGYDDCGLMGMVFHPEYGHAGSTNRGYFYVFYQYTPTPTNPLPNRPDWMTPTYNRLSRFTVPDGSLVADPNSELVLVNQFDQNIWHNGCGLFFGPDGFLYWSNGDEGGADDQYHTAQKINDGLFSGVFRIDVNQDPAKSHPIIRQPLSGAPPPPNWLPTYTSNYFIPNDNPFVNPDGSVLEEFFALGFRNPHRMTFDAPSGRIWLSDVGDSAREEVDLIVSGGNYQWDYTEGLNFPGPNAKPSPLIGIDSPPIYDYPHADGNSCIIGGYVYRGSLYATNFGGQYIFGDNYSGRIWSLAYDGTNAPIVTYLCNMPPGLLYSGLSSFGLDQSNEIYMCQMGPTGQIFKMVPALPAQQPPALLSQVGVFTNLATLAPAPGLIPYNVNCPLWSDGAVKSRWLALPNDGNSPSGVINFYPTGEWAFPAGAVFVKHFELPTNDLDPSVTKRLETRLLVCTSNGNYYGLTYKWRADYSDADLLTNSLSEDIVIATTNGSTRTQTWYYPSQQDCLICHNPAANYVLGVKTRQLNGNFTYPATGVTDNQLRVFNHLGLFYPVIDEASIPTYSSLVSVTNASASLDDRMRSYLDSNCSQCHRPSSGVSANFDARYDTPLANQQIIAGLVANNLGLPGAQVVAPSSPGNSIMYLRMNVVGTNQMPPLARNVIDTNAVATLVSWINSYVSPAITAQPQSQTNILGGSATFSVAVSGTGPFSYQWQLNATNLASATDSGYSISPVQAADAGNYSVTVSCIAGTVVSSNATLTVNGPPVIVGQPQGTTTNLGSSVTLDVSCLGTPPLSFQWFFNGAPINGATNSNYSLPDFLPGNGGNYSVLVTNYLGFVLSSNASLVVILPSPTNWSDADIGVLYATGSSAYSNGVFTIQGSGDDIWNNADAFNYVYQPLDGDGAIVARVLNVQDTDGWAKAGVMFRETLDADSTDIYMLISAENGASFQYRQATGGGSAAISGPNVGAPYWVKLMRQTNTFTGYTSSDGVNWSPAGSIVVNMTNNVFIGLAVCAHNNGVLNTSTLDNVQFLGSILTPPDNLAVGFDADVTFSALVYGTPLNYQWLFNGSSIAGATDSDYTITDVQATNAGNYSLVVTNLAGSVASSNAVLTVGVPPILSAISDQSVYAGVLLTFTATLANADTNAPFFSLDPGAPAGAAINSSSGVFAWTPTADQTGANQVTIRVIDSLSLTDSQSFLVNVLTGPSFQGVTVSGSQITLNWNALSGRSYRIQYKTHLTDPVWNDLPGDVTASGNTAAKTDSIGGDAQRFYRIVLLQ